MNAAVVVSSIRFPPSINNINVYVGGDIVPSLHRKISDNPPKEYEKLQLIKIPVPNKENNIRNTNRKFVRLSVQFSNIRK